MMAEGLRGDLPQAPLSKTAAAAKLMFMAADTGLIFFPAPRRSSFR
jgi:hypothetical protein